MKPMFLTGAALVFPAIASAQTVVTDPDTQALLAQSASIQLQILATEKQAWTELQVIAAEEAVPGGQRALVAEKLRWLAAAAGQSSTATLSSPSAAGTITSGEAGH